uniref:Leucine rich repeat containing 71 n=1 Tax=Cyclopterus lumpus TaxID=8103 RepID=A0A8C2ZYP4_CYCLU
MSRERHKEKTDKSCMVTASIHPTDEYQCSGDVETDFPGLCALLDIKDIPTVITRQPAPSTTETEGGKQELKHNIYSNLFQIYTGWKVDEQIARVIQKMCPSLSNCHRFVLVCLVRCWQAGLTDRMVVSLMDTVSRCSNLRAVTLEGNHLPERSYHLLLSEDSALTHVSLRNNRMGDEGAQLIGSALSTTRSANKNLLSLNLAFNSIGDAGATHIAQGLRFNRGLLVLSLCNNHIGDSGAAHLAAILGEFALTHEEVVERRKMLLERTHSVSAAISNTHSSLKLILILNIKVSHQKLIQVTWLCCMCIRVGNRITTKSLPLFLTSLEMQGEGGGLLRLCLQRNRFPPDCEYFVKITEQMTLRDPLKQNS